MQIILIVCNKYCNNVSNIHFSFKNIFIFVIYHNNLFILRDINTFIHQGCIKLIKSDSEDILQKISTLNKFCSFELSIHQRILKNKMFTVSTQILCSTTVFNMDNNQKCFLSSKSAYYYDFWRSCDTEDE